MGKYLNKEEENFVEAFEKYFKEYHHHGGKDLVSIIEDLLFDYGYLLEDRNLNHSMFSEDYINVYKSMQACTYAEFLVAMEHIEKLHGYTR